MKQSRITSYIYKKTSYLYKITCNLYNQANKCLCTYNLYVIMINRSGNDFIVLSNYNIQVFVVNCVKWQKLSCFAYYIFTLWMLMLIFINYNIQFFLKETLLCDIFKLIKVSQEFFFDIRLTEPELLIFLVLQKKKFSLYIFWQTVKYHLHVLTNYDNAKLVNWYFYSFALPYFALKVSSFCST